MKLCGNCLESGNHRPVDVGPNMGTQREPYRAYIVLCETCRTALIGGDFTTLHERYRAERTVRQ